MSRPGETSLTWWMVVLGVAGMVLSTAVAPTVAQSSPSNSITIEIQADGSAEWTVVNAVPLPLEADREAFDEIAANETRTAQMLDETVTLYGAVAEGASRQLDREMTVEDGEIELQRDGSTGFIIVTFRWTAFAQVEGNTMLAGDMFAGGFPLRTNETLTIQGPEGYRLTSHNVTSPNATVDEAGAGEITWTGPDTIRSSINVRYERNTPTPTSSPAGGDDTSADEGNDSTEGATETASAEGPGFGIVAALLAIVALVVGRRRS